MLIKLINPRGRVIELDDKESNLKKLLQQGFVIAPDGVEAGKKYNPVFDRGQEGADEQKMLGTDKRTSVSSQVLGNTLGVVWL
jgi:hypothetical protein